MREFAAVIVAGIGVIVSGVAAVGLMAIRQEGWGCVCAGLCIGFAAAFAIEYSDLRASLEAQKIVRAAKWVTPPDFPPQRKRPIR
jgi:hypothetical protein